MTKDIVFFCNFDRRMHSTDVEEMREISSNREDTGCRLEIAVFILLRWKGLNSL